jgi:hypothetical protein
LIAGQDCLACPAGQYQDVKGQTTCLDCDVDTYLIESGKASKAECQKCNEDRATGTTTGNTQPSACLCKRIDHYQNDNHDCKPCPPGADCANHDGMKLTELFAKNGYWRGNTSSNDFVSCSLVYSSANANKLANERCCPATSNCSMVNNNATNTTWNADAQCLPGYQGVLCGTCAKDYVRRGDNCEACDGGWQLGGAIGSMLGSCVVVFIVSFVLVKRTKTLDKHKQHDIVEEISAQFKILTSWLQILSVLTKTFNAVPWGSSFTSFSQSSGTVVNLDLSFLSSMATGSLSLPFLEQYGLSTLYPVVITIAIFSGRALAMIGVKDLDRRLAQTAKGDKIFLLFIMLLFPSIANKSFTVLRCREIPGLEYTVLDEDFSVKCFEAHHTMYVVIACITIAVCKCFFEYFFFSPLSR